MFIEGRLIGELLGHDFLLSWLRSARFIGTHVGHDGRRSGRKKSDKMIGTEGMKEEG